jgi:hypothetical protein
MPGDGTGGGADVGRMKRFGHYLRRNKDAAVVFATAVIVTLLEIAGDVGLRDCGEQDLQSRSAL